MPLCYAPLEHNGGRNCELPRTSTDVYRHSFCEKDELTSKFPVSFRQLVEESLSYQTSYFIV